MNQRSTPQTIGLAATTALVVGTIVGSGIFMLPVALAPLGRNALIGWLISGAGIMGIAYALARLSKLGGEGLQANIEREFGPVVGFAAAWSFWVSYWVAGAAVALAAASAMSFASPALIAPGAVLPVAVGWVVVLTAINSLGVRMAGGFSILTVGIKLVPLLAVVWIFGERSIGGPAFEPFAPLPVNPANLAAATALTFFAFTGFETVTAPVGKVRDPARTIPRALIGGTGFVVLLYLVTATAIQLLLPASVVAASPAPFADALVARFGQGAASLAAIAIAVAAVGCLNGLILATGEIGYAMALRGDLPGALAKTRSGNTPVAAQWAGSALAIALLLANSSRATAGLYTLIVLVSTAAIVVVYLAGCLAAWRCSPLWRQRCPILFALGFLAFASWGIGFEPVAWSLALLAAGLVLRLAIRRSSVAAG